MIARALSNPRLPPGGWATNDVRTDHLSMLRHPLRHRPPPRSHGLSPQARPLFWAEYSGGAPCFQLKQAAPKTIPQWKLGREPPVWWTAECDAKEAERRRRRARSVRGVKLSLSATELRNALKEALAANQDRVVDTLRRWDGDGSGRIDAREFFRACTDGLRLAGWPASTYMELFASIDDDSSGEIDYKELNAALRRSVDDVGFGAAFAKRNVPRPASAAAIMLDTPAVSMVGGNPRLRSSASRAAPTRVAW